MIRVREGCAVALVGLLSLATGCSGDDDSDASRPGGQATKATSTTATSQAITMEQASRLADVLVHNRDAANAAVTAEYTTSDGVITLDGSVDWPGAQGMFNIKFPEAPNQLAPAQVAYSGSSVFQRFPNLAADFEAAGYPGAEWVVQQADPDTSPLVRFLGLISGAAAEQRDNPTQLVARGVTSLGVKTLAGIEVEGFDMGKTTYWVGKEDGFLHRLEADLGGDPVVVDFAAWGKSPVMLPSDDVIVDASILAGLLKASQPSAG